MKFNIICFNLLVVLLLSSCAAVEEPVNFSYGGFGEDTVLLGLSKASVAGELRLSAKTEPLRFRFEPPLQIGSDASLEAEYYFPQEPAHAGEAGDVPYRVIAEFDASGGTSWEFPREVPFLSGENPGPMIRLSYAVPLNRGVISEFSINAVDTDSGSKSKGAWVLRSLKLITRWYGFDLSNSNTAYPVIKFTPYVMRDSEGSLLISPQPEYRFLFTPELTLGGVSGDAFITAGKTRFEYRPPFSSRDFLIPSGGLDDGIYPVTLSGSNAASAFSLTALVLAPAPERPFPREPIPADPGLILSYPREAWRSTGYEVFRWPDFPEVLILDTANYTVQERLFKRLAFFVEKRDYRGRLIPDQELEGLHGWNAHDYRAGDLARFFETARLAAFPLLDEERELCTLLLENGILSRGPGGEIVPGIGAVLSVSQESPDYLRNRFMVHECFHGLFFIDEDFRNFSRGRWDNFSGEAKRFFNSYLDSQRYDLADTYLVVNEFMAYCLQQSASLAPAYFGETLASQIDNNPSRRAVLPLEEYKADGSKYWPTLARAFSREAEAFSDYASRRWGLSSGRVRTITVSRVKGEE